MAYSYKVKLQVFDNTSKLVKQDLQVFSTDGFKTVANLKELSNNGQYADSVIASETFHVGGIVSEDTITIDKSNFLLHTINLK